MKYKINNRLLSTIFVSVCIGCLITGIFAYTEIQNLAYKNFKDSYAVVLQQIDKYFTQFLSEGVRSAKQLAVHPGAQNAVGALKTFYDSPATPSTDENSPEEVLRLIQNMKRSLEANKAYTNAFLGVQDGGFMHYPDTKVKTGYDPRKRPWWPDIMQSSNDYVITSAYVSTTGKPVSSILVKVHDKNGKNIGAIGYDVNLSDLTDFISNFSIGKTGYLMLIENNNTILSDPKHDDLIFKKADAAQEPFIASLTSVESGVRSGTIDGKEMLALTHTSAYGGWKVALLIEKDEVFASVRAVVFKILIAGIITAILLTGIGWLLVRDIIRSIKGLVIMASQVTEGDYTCSSCHAPKAAELSMLQQTFLTMLSTIMQNMETAQRKTQEAEHSSQEARTSLKSAQEAKENAEAAYHRAANAGGKVNDVVAELSSLSQDMVDQFEKSNAGAERQQKRMEEIAMAMQSISSSTEQVTHAVQDTSSKAEDAIQKALNGVHVVENVIESIGGIQAETDAMNAKLDRLEKQTHDIGDVIELIREVADQTNLLALNAAIEAARAGEAGKGFAVVADEVKKLAEKTLQATNKVESTVRAIRAGAKDSLQGIKQTTTRVNQGAELAREAGDALESINAIVESTTHKVMEISHANEKQLSSSREVSDKAIEVSDISTSTASAMNDALGAVSEMVDMIGRLKLVAKDLRSN